MSHTTPIMSREKTEPETEAMPALPMSNLSRLRLSRMMGMRGGAAKVEVKHMKKANQEMWKERMCGAAMEKMRSFRALCSESTGSANFAMLSSFCSTPPTDTLNMPSLGAALACSPASVPAMDALQPRWRSKVDAGGQLLPSRPSAFHPAPPRKISSSESRHHNEQLTEEEAQ
eukprot:TRINITY_DN26771_c0_g1_i1.p2 TRINITY_DN26771_c0_g1~~TRINITY_DN26771_c0_g1_i1.p2  ORF type:complete len:173 (-),score=7.77 TRINITY_DN26771_c0_g1_i1:129-647(-)